MWLQKISILTHRRVVRNFVEGVFKRPKFLKESAKLCRNFQRGAQRNRCLTIGSSGDPLGSNKTF